MCVYRINHIVEHNEGLLKDELLCTGTEDDFNIKISVFNSMVKDIISNLDFCRP